MTVKEFINKCKTSKDVEKFIEDRIKIKYLSYAKKITLSDRILKSTCYTGTEPNLFKISSPMKKMLFMLSVVNEYTDIDIDWENSVDDYDLLSENAYINIIINKIGTTEVNCFSSVLEMMLNDLFTNERDLVSYIDTKFEAIKLGISPFLDIINIEEIRELISNRLS